MTVEENPYLDSFTGGLSEAWDSLGDAAHNAGYMAVDAGQIAYHTGAAMGNAFLGDTASVDHHLSERHGYERELSGDYDKFRRDLGFSAADVPTPSSDSFDGAASDFAASDDGIGGWDDAGGADDAVGAD
jgi:hypothetical protein